MCRERLFCINKRGNWMQMCSCIPVQNWCFPSLLPSSCGSRHPWGAPARWGAPGALPFLLAQGKDRPAVTRKWQLGSELCEARGPALGRTRPAVGAHPELRAAAQQRADVEPETRSKVRTSRRKHAFKQYVQLWLPMLSAVPIRSVICVCFYFTFT